MTNYIWVTAQRAMIHQYPDAPEGVEFLKNAHRHMFKFKVSIEVMHNDRDIEFILFKQFVEKILVSLDADLKEKSCEMISDYLYYEINAKHPNRNIIIEVSEDGENGSLYEYKTEDMEQADKGNGKITDYVDKS